MFYMHWAVKTHLLVRKHKPLRSFDDMLSDTLVKVMKAEGPTLHTHSVPKEITKESDGSLTVHLENGNSVNVDTVIWAIGRKPHTHSINLEASGVENRQPWLYPRG